jgi:hypothetical protein
LRPTSYYIFKDEHPRLARSPAPSSSWPKPRSASPAEIRFTATLRRRRATVTGAGLVGLCRNTSTVPPTPLSPPRWLPSWQGHSPVGSAELVSDDVGVNPRLLPRATVPLTHSPPEDGSPSDFQQRTTFYSSHRLALPVGRRSSPKAPKHPSLGLSPVCCRSSSPSSDQAPPASSCSATRPASTPASPDPRDHS